MTTAQNLMEISKFFIFNTKFLRFAHLFTSTDRVPKMFLKIDHIVTIIHVKTLEFMGNVKIIFSIPNVYDLHIFFHKQPMGSLLGKNPVPELWPEKTEK